MAAHGGFYYGAKGEMERNSSVPKGTIRTDVKKWKCCESSADTGSGTVLFSHFLADIFSLPLSHSRQRTCWNLCGSIKG